MRRRELLTASAVAAVALAGCSSSEDESSENSDDESMEADEAEASPGEEAVAVVEEFYAAYNDADLDKANALAHEEYPGEELKPEDFQDWGGIEKMSWTVQETEIVRESEDLVEVHADVIVQTPIGNGDDIDYFLLAPEDGEWRYVMFLPRPVREEMSQEEIDEAMRRDS